MHPPSRYPMSTIRDQPENGFASQAKLVFGSAIATGLQIGLLQAYLLRRPSSIWISVLASLVFGAVTLFLWQRVFPRLRTSAGSKRPLVQALAALLAMAATSFVVVNGLMWLGSGRWMFSPYTGGDVTVDIEASVIAWSPYIYFAFPIVPAALAAVVGFNQSWWQIFMLQRSEHHAREMAALAQLDALRAQINPHFLFNSLNSIAQLISSDPCRAEECVERLAEIFRYLLKSENRSFVTLADELDIADAYLDIERARFGDRLAVDFVVDDEARNRFVPTLILQPLIENAVRHGVSRKIGGGRVSIEAALQGDDLQVVVRDTGVGIGQGVENATSNGVGLRNVHDRLVHLFGEAYAPRIDSHPGEGTAVTVRVPRLPDGLGSAMVH
ncbi:MAG: hypothetical protein FJ144_03470 [Deltaproteobacteria bacterium]|nr:hypothetical protein [Deltaproteobacteria bacterium]